MEMMSIVKNSNDSEDVHNVSIKLNSGEDDHNAHLQLRSDEDVHNLSTKQKSAQEFKTHGTKSGLNNDEIALMLIISGGVDFASRLAIGAFTDFNLLTTTQIVAIAQIIIGTASHFTHFYTSFEALMVLAVIIGVFGGVRQTFGTLICLQFMGAEKYVQALGFQTMTATLTMAVHHPLLSSILEVSGSFNFTLTLCGCGCISECNNSTARTLHQEDGRCQTDVNRDKTSKLITETN
ncbi:hypothetical protein Btru_072857 [Bulinus truncatus]|nr:hypothetical protein Btru_072857 [Bulinus truncatus]